jgi:creatinine amidohydrolase
MHTKTEGKSDRTPWLIANSTYPQVREVRYAVAVLPWGATEAHGKHLPYSTDIVEIEALAANAARLAWDAGAAVAVLPAIPFGVQTGQLDLPFCINLNPSTQAAILFDVISSLKSSGVNKFVILNGHGGNDFKQILRELTPHFPHMFLAVASWFSVDDGKGLFDAPGDHADERETSLMLDLRPDLVRPPEEWGDGSSNEWTIPALRRKWAWAQRHWTEATNDTGVGDPRAATAEKGKQYFERISQRMAEFFVDLANTPLDRFYQRPIAGG